MVGAFGIFATLSMIEMKQLGVGLATAVLLDATIVRGVLLPATLRLLGENAWHESALAQAPAGAHGHGERRRATRRRDHGYVRAGRDMRRAGKR